MKYKKRYMRKPFLFLAFGAMVFCVAACVSSVPPTPDSTLKPQLEEQVGEVSPTTEPVFESTLAPKSTTALSSTATAVASPTDIPIDTTELTGTPTPTVLLPAQEELQNMAYSEKTVNLRGGPGTEYDKRGIMDSRGGHEVLGKYKNGRGETWLQIQGEGNSVVWILSTLAYGTYDVSSLPDVEQSEIAPTPTPSEDKIASAPIQDRVGIESRIEEFLAGGLSEKRLVSELGDPLPFGVVRPEYNIVHLKLLGTLEHASGHKLAIVGGEGPDGRKVFMVRISAIVGQPRPYSDIMLQTAISNRMNANTTWQQLSAQEALDELSRHIGEGVWGSFYPDGFKDLETFAVQQESTRQVIKSLTSGGPAPALDMNITDAEVLPVFSGGIFLVDDWSVIGKY